MYGGLLFCCWVYRKFSLKVIFIDIDGPLLSGNCHLLPCNVRLWENLCKASDNNERRFETKKKYVLGASFDQAAVMLLNRLAQKSGAKIVIHSNWRKSVGSAEAKTKLILEGVDESHFHEDYACTFKMNSSKQGDINGWLSKHRMKRRPKQPKPYSIMEEGYCRKAQHDWHVACADCGIDYVILDDECASVHQGDQVYINYDDAFSLEDYRLACGILKSSDHSMDVFSLSESVMSAVSQHIPSFGTRNKWLYSLRDNEGYIVPRASFLSFDAAKISFDGLSGFGIRKPEKVEDLFESRSARILKDLKVEYRVGKLHPSIVDSYEELMALDGISRCKSVPLPRVFPCIVITAVANCLPVYMYAPDECFEPSEFLYGYLSAIEYKAI
jgi:hypothetical protein